MTESPLDLFHPLIREWFEQSFPGPTEIQALAWPRIAAEEHVLITAPTGSGKTLTAFLWALDRLLRGDWPTGRVRVLYISPLRALNTDISRNLERPLTELVARFRQAGLEVPPLRAMTRSGDTPPDERRKMLKNPPEILITTPESLNILLTSKSGRSLLTGLATVILDEVHAVVASKRGTHLITAVERLAPLTGEFQRVALSATVKPLHGIAEWIGGYRVEETAGEVVYRRREVSIVQAEKTTKVYDLKVHCPPESQAQAEDDDARWASLTRDFKRVIRKNRATLFFANSRRLTEKVTRLINQEENRDLAYSHHGSLSREVRAVVEQRLKDGELPAIVATNSLELGIDIGSLDEVVLIQTPRAISSTIQRVGRAGHGVGEVSHGRLYPTFGRDFLDAAVAARAVREQDIEEMRPIIAPLDVLAQVILSMVATEPWPIEDVYAQVRASMPYHGLSRRQFDLVLEMLAGRYADSRIRDLRPRVTVDRVSGEIRARPGVARLIYMAGGTIADRGYFSLRLEGSLAKLGELDEEFTWERSLGDTFSLGAQNWQIRKITHNDVIVVPARKSSAMAPFWRADAEDRGFYFSEKIGLFLESIEERLEDKELPAELTREHSMRPAAAAELLDFLKQQKAATGVLPHRHRVVVERVGHRLRHSHEHSETHQRVIFHTFWGGRVNRPLALALSGAWEEEYGESLETVHDDDCLMLMLPRPMGAEEILALVPPEHLENLLRQRLEKTGFFGSRFRTNASTALLLPKAGFRNRTPLWLNRQRAKKLGEAVSRYGDFPILVETWRMCLQDEFELETLKSLLREIREDKIRLEEVTTESASPFAGQLGWQLTNQFMYEDDTPTGSAKTGVSQDLLRELVFSSQLRPRLPADLVEQFRHKIQRTAPGYAPRDAVELQDWIDERILIPPAEWQELMARMEADSGLAEDELRRELNTRVVLVTLPGSSEPCVCSVERVARLVEWGSEIPSKARRALLPPLKKGGGGGFLASLIDPAQEPPEEALEALDLLLEQRTDIDRPKESDPWVDLIGEWLRFQGPLTPERLGQVFGLDAAALREILQSLGESGLVVVDQLVKRGPDVLESRLEVCDAQNLEILLRWLRQEGRPGFTALPSSALPLFLARHQGLVRQGDGPDALRENLEQLFGYPAPAAAWEAEILPARLKPYYTSWLDSLVQESDLLWFGCGKARLSFAFPVDLELFQEAAGKEGKDQEDLADDGPAALFPPARRRHTLGELAAHSGRTTAAVTEDLWRLAWDGRVSNDSFIAVRKGIENKWKPAEPQSLSHQSLSHQGHTSARQRAGRRSAFRRWQVTRPFFGHWFVLERDSEPRDALEEEELRKDRVRGLLQRYGVLFRELLVREAPVQHWGRLFRTLRIMELSGEVLAGHFFEGIPGLQFISHAAFRELSAGLPEDAIYWMNAADPASLCGADIQNLKASLPARHATTHLTFHGQRLVLVSRRRGRELDIRVDPEHPHLEQYLEVLKVLLTREFQPLSSIEVEKINDKPAASSGYREVLDRLFRVVKEPRGLKLWKRYGSI